MDSISVQILNTNIAKTTVKIKMLHIFLSNIFLLDVLYNQFYILQKKNKKTSLVWL